MDFKPDKRVVNVAQNPATAGGSAADVLVDNGIMKTDANGEATLRNSNNYLVLVDGKQSVFNGTEALLQIQANYCRPHRSDLLILQQNIRLKAMQGSSI